MKKNRKSRLCMVELAMSGEFHAGVNAGLLRVMGEVFPEKELFFRAEKNQARACRRRLGEAPVSYGTFPFFPGISKYTLPLRDLLGCIYLLRLFLCFRRKDAVFITNLLPLTHWCAVGLNRIFRRELFICLHGQLEALLPDTPLRGTKWYFRLHGPLFRVDRRTRYVMLGEPVFRAVGPLFSPACRVIVIDHPYDYDTTFPVPPPYTLPLRFGQAGTGNRGKGTEKLFRLGELLRDEIHAGKVELHLAGRLDPELRKTANEWVKYPVEPLSSREFDTILSALHYTLLLREPACGRAVPSGSFFDSVKYGKPFLSLDHAFVCHYAERSPGCGKLYPSVEEMAGAIRKIINNPEKERYESAGTALNRLREGLSVPAIAENFRKQVEK